MKLPRFGVEEWLNVHEKSAICDIAGVSIKALTMRELFDHGTPGIQRREPYGRRAPCHRDRDQAMVIV